MLQLQQLGLPFGFRSVVNRLPILTICLFLISVWEDITVFLETIKDKIGDKMSLVLCVFDVNLDDEHDKMDKFVSAERFEIAEDEIMAQAEKVFVDDYKKDLKQWVGVLTSLEEKGYQKQEILDLLGQEPVNRWKIFAKRLPSVK